MENIILVDGNTTENWEFQKALEKATQKKWRVIASVSNKNHGSNLQKLIRYTKYFWFPFKIFLKRREYSSVLAWQQFYGIILAFYFRLFRVRKVPSITVMTFIYKPKKGLIGIIYKNFMKYVVTSGYVKRFIVFSNSEPDYYANILGVSKDLFVPELLGITDQMQRCQQLIADMNVFISAGRSNRDYDFIRDSWPENAPSIEIISDMEKQNNRKSRDNIRYLTNCHGEEFIKKLAQCHAVVLALADEKISSGQLVILQAMMLGKPVIVTKNHTVNDYIENGVDGLIINKDKESLEWAIKQLEEPELYNTIAKNARRSFEEKYSSNAMGLRIGEKIKKGYEGLENSY